MRLSIRGLWLAESVVTPEKSADTIVQLLLEEIIPRHSCPLQIVTEKGTENKNRVMRKTLQILDKISGLSKLRKKKSMPGSE